MDSARSRSNPARVLLYKHVLIRGERIDDDGDALQRAPGRGAQKASRVVERVVAIIFPLRLKTATERDGRDA